MPKDAQVFEFETYLKDRERRTLCPIEKAGTEAALDRCRMLVDRIASDLHEKKSEHFVNILSLAEFHASLERAASVLGICGESQDQVTAMCTARRMLSLRGVTRTMRAWQKANDYVPGM